MVSHQVERLGEELTPLWQLWLPALRLPLLVAVTTLHILLHLRIWRLRLGFVSLTWLGAVRAARIDALYWIVAGSATG